MSDAFIYTVSLCLCVQLVTQHTFLDYVMGGCQINFTVHQHQQTRTHFKCCISIHQSHPNIQDIQLLIIT